MDRWATLRLVHLGPNAARLARAVSVLERAELGQAARLAGLALPEAARAADLLVRAGVLDDVPLCFAHPLVRGAVYRDMGTACLLYTSEPRTPNWFWSAVSSNRTGSDTAKRRNHAPRSKVR